MAVSPEYLEHLRDLLDGFGPVDMRRMFGGAGLFRDGLMFGLVADDALYFKVGDANRADYADTGAAPFTYATKDGQRRLTSYYQAPAELFDDPDALVAWARKAYDAAVAANAARPRRKGR